jgi:hypothetical protein
MKMLLYNIADFAEVNHGCGYFFSFVDSGDDLPGRFLYFKLMGLKFSLRF